MLEEAKKEPLADSLLTLLGSVREFLAGSPVGAEIADPTGKVLRRVPSEATAGVLHTLPDPIDLNRAMREGLTLWTWTHLPPYDQ